uniref:Uncharacterized protein n=1 Tax=Arundo donax TaxID=35708 RepID=A0A0A8YFG4_ARUDO
MIPDRSKDKTCRSNKEQLETSA